MVMQLIFSLVLFPSTPLALPSTLSVECHLTTTVYYSTML